MTKEWEKPEDLRRRKPVLWLTMTALFMAMVVVLSMSALSIPVPGGHLYFNDVVIDTAAMLMDPLSAFIACGVGAFLGDLLFYPAPMFVSLITHGLQALVISLLCRKLRMKQPLACAIAVLAGAIVMVVGYTLGRALNALARLLNRTILHRHPMRTDFEYVLDASFREISGGIRSMSVSISFGLLLLCIGLYVTCLYLLQ